jgi:hypothetical protein
MTAMAIILTYLRNASTPVGKPLGMDNLDYGYQKEGHRDRGYPTNTIIRLSHAWHDQILKEEFAKVGITDRSSISSFHIRMRTIVTNTPPSEQEPMGSFIKIILVSD